MKTFLLASAAGPTIASAAGAQTTAPVRLADNNGGAAPVSALSTDPATPTASDEAADGHAATDVVVTGVRGGAPRTVADSPVPIDVISPRELRAMGRVGLKKVLGNIVPSLTMPAQGGGGTSASVRPIAIRGLSGDYLLGLVNGKRRHTTALINNLSRIAGGSTPVDLDLIPTVAVGERRRGRDRFGRPVQCRREHELNAPARPDRPDPPGKLPSATSARRFAVGPFPCAGSYRRVAGGRRTSVRQEWNRRVRRSDRGLPPARPRRAADAAGQAGHRAMGPVDFGLLASLLVGSIPASQLPA